MYERQRGQLDRQMQETAGHMLRKPATLIDLDATMAFAKTLLVDLHGCWNRLGWT